MRLTAEMLERACEEMARQCHDQMDAVDLLELQDEIAAMRRRYGGMLDDVLAAAGEEE